MKEPHLSEEAIQEWALAPQGTPLPEHFSVCHHCQELLVQYQQLHGAITRATPPVFEFSVEAQVMPVLFPEPPKQSVTRNAIPWLVLSPLLVLMLSALLLIFFKSEFWTILQGLCIAGFLLGSTVYQIHWLIKKYEARMLLLQ